MAYSLVVRALIDGCCRTVAAGGLTSISTVYVVVDSKVQTAPRTALLDNGW